MAAKLIHQPDVDQDVWDAYDDVRFRKKSAAICTLSDDEKRIVLKTAHNNNVSWDEIVASFDEQEVAWAFINFKYETKNGGKHDKLLYIVWSPDALQRETHKATILVKSGAVQMSAELADKAVMDGAKRLEINDFGEWNAMDVLRAVSKHEKDEIDEESFQRIWKITS